MKFKKLMSALTSAAVSLSTFAGAGAAIGNSAMTAGAASANWKFDFGGGGTASGYTGVSASDGYSASRGYGFAQTGNVSNVSAGGSGAGSDAVKFNSYGTGNTFNVDLPRGLYEIRVTTGNSPRTTIRIEGMVQMMNLTNNNAVETIQIPVTDGQLNIQAVEGMSGREQSIAALEVTQLNTTGDMKPTIWICGDSTVANYYNTKDSAQHGWGQFLGDYIDRSYWEVRNQATSGQYAKGFVDEGQFEPIECYGKQGDIYIISIGINDTAKSNTTEYYNVVTDMVKRAKAKGMTVLLVKQQGRRADLNRSPRLSERWYSSELTKIGVEQGVEVIDLFTPWQDFGFSLGYDGMASYYATQADGSADDLHQSKKGAMKLAEIMSTLYGFDGGGSLSAEMNENVYYTFRNVNSGLYMEVAGGNAAIGANVEQRGADAAAKQNAWKLTSAGSGYYYITSALDSSYYLDIEAGRAADGQNAALYVFKGADNQQFRFRRNSDGSYTILTKVSGDKSALDVSGASMDAGANIQQWTANGNSCQNWIAEAVSLPLDGRLVSGLTVLDKDNSAGWGIADNSASGMKLFGDRDFTVDSLPQLLAGAEHIITACDSKNATGDTATFTARENIIVYVALDMRVSAPYWLGAYSNTGVTFACNNETFAVYSAEFQAGSRVTLGSNGASSNCMNYSVFVKEQPAVTTTTTTTTTTTSTTTTTTTAAITTTSTWAPAVTSTTQAPPVNTSEDTDKTLPGDANCDGKVTVADAVAILQSIANKDKYDLSPQGKINGDVDGVAGITGMDALFLQQVDAGMRKLPEAAAAQTETSPATTTTTTTTTAPVTTTEAATVPMLYYAADQSWSEGNTETTNGGFSKTDAAMGSSYNIGYVNLDNKIGSSITFSIRASIDGNYMTHIRYANGTSTDRKTNVFVNGDTQTYWVQSFPGTGTWTDWAEIGIVLPLKAGVNTIRFESAVSDGGPNFDYIDLTLTDEPVAETFDPNTAQMTVDGNKPAIFLAGDSTCMYYNASKQSQNGGPIQGWGYYLPDYFSDDVTVYNHAIAGRSSKKFYDEGRFAEITANLKQGDFVMIQFAINDAGAANADRYAPTCGNVDDPSSGSYEWYMTSFIRDTLAKGATPVLMSCTLSAKSYSNGRFSASYTNYTDACRKLAAKYNVPFVDVNGAMVDHYNSVGYNTALSYHMASAVQGSTDMTHFNEGGAKVIAELIAKTIRAQSIAGLSNHVK